MENHLTEAFIDKFITIGVRFDGSSKMYTYKTTDKSIEVLDNVVVMSPRSGLTVATVFRVDHTPKIDFEAPFMYKQIVCKVDEDAYNNRLDAERKLRELYESKLVEREAAKKRSEIDELFGEDKKGKKKFLKLLGKVYD